MWNWIKKVWSAVTGGAEKVGGAAAAVAGNKTVDAIALAAGQAALATMSPQAQAVASAALALTQALSTGLVSRSTPGGKSGRSLYGRAGSKPICRKISETST